MVIVQQPSLLGHVHIQTRKTKPGGELTWEKWSMLLKCILSTETLLMGDCRILRSELVSCYLLHHLIDSYAPTRPVFNFYYHNHEPKN